MAEEGEVIIRRRRWPRVLAILALLLGLLVLGLWLVRKPIARDQVDSFLTTAGVPARYTISDLGLGRQRLTNVVLGDPARPDLVADWLETRTRWSLSGPTLASVRGGHVRVRARWADGKLSLGSLDRLLPKDESGKPFALPALALDVAELRAQVNTPWGLVGAKLVGSGRLDGGFDGRLAVTSGRLDVGCAADAPGAVLHVTTSSGKVRLRGPVELPSASCAGARVVAARADVDATVSLGRQVTWVARAVLTARDIRHARGEATGVGGTVIARSWPDGVRGTMALTGARLAGAGSEASEVRLDGEWTYAAKVFRVGGIPAGARLMASRVRLPEAILGRVAALAGTAAGTPLDPLARQLAAAVARSGRAFSLDADVVGGTDGKGGGDVGVRRALLRTPRGAEVALASGSDVAWLFGGRPHASGRVTLRGDGLPTATVLLEPAAAGTPFKGRVLIQPYAAGGARLALTPVAFAQQGGGWRVTTSATLSGPLGDGRVDGLTLPLDATWRGGVLTLGPACTPVRWERVATSGLVLDPGGLSLCPDGGPLVRVAGGRIGGGARIAAARLTGRLGSTPLTLAAAGAHVRLAERGFALTDVEAMLGAPARLTRLSVGSVDGRFSTSGLTGRFAEAGGQIGNVPLVLSSAAGTWWVAGGALALDGGLTVSDAATPARFQPMAARGVTLRFAQGQITAGGTLHEPATGTKVADVVLRHDLAAGRGAADLTVPSLSFVKGFQPDQLTRLTFGVIADVRGTVSGEGHLAWTPAGITSTGVFRTAGTDLAAAFGPVTGLAGEIRFTDLLQLQSAPGQQVTVKSINPGVPVTDGVVTFQTLPGTRVNVEGGRWPFAGGELTLDPTLLDFSAAAQRRLTFRVAGAAADKFLQSFDFKNLDATGTFDGVLPMVFDANGGRIEDGRLTVRPGGGTIAYVGDIGRENLGFWGDFAFDTLKSLRYRSLGIVMNGPLAGEMVTEVRFAGISQGEGAKSNFIIRRLQRLPVVFNIRIRAPFRGLLDATASFYDPKRLIERNLPELIQRQQTIQPPASETVP